MIINTIEKSSYCIIEWRVFILPILLISSISFYFSISNTVSIDYQGVSLSFIIVIPHMLFGN